MWLWKLESLKFVGYSSRLETPADFCVVVFRHRFFFFGKSLPLMPSSDWVYLYYRDNLVYLESTDDKYWSYLTITFTAISRLVFNQTVQHHRLAKLTQKINQNPWPTFPFILPLSPSPFFWISWLSFYSGHLICSFISEKKCFLLWSLLFLAHGLLFP